MIFALVPFYLLGNLHCAGMCGPLVMLLCQHRFVWLYFVGRTLSFTLVALFAQMVGLLMGQFLLPSLLALVAGLAIVLLGLNPLLKHRLLRPTKLGSKINLFLVRILEKKDPQTPFLFGLCTVLLPCGQSLVVFSACAVSGNWQFALVNGLLFSLLTTPGLIGALFFGKTFAKFRKKFPSVISLATVAIGGLLVLRSLADLHLINHCTLNEQWHLVLF